MPRASQSPADRGIRNLGPKLWEVSVSGGLDRGATAVAGKAVYRRRWVRVHGTLTDARARRRQLLTELEQPNGKGTGATVDQLLDEWLVELERAGRAPKTIATYRNDAKTYWRSAIGAMEVSKVTVRDVDRVLGALTDRGVKPATVHHVHACLSAAFSQAMRWEWIKADPTKLVRRPSKTNTRPQVPTPAQLAKVIRAAEDSARPEIARFLWMGAVTGARSSELRALRVSDLDLDGGWLGIERAISNETVWTTKNRRIRDVGLDGATVEVVRAQVAFMDARAADDGATLATDSYLFSDDLTGRKHWREDAVTRTVSNLFDQIGAPDLTFKHLRKFMDTYAQELGFTDVAAAMRAGHDPSVARKHYTGQVAATDRALSAALAGLLTDAQ